MDYLLRSCTVDWGGDWEQHLSLVEFTYNNAYQAGIGMVPFESLYGRPCRSPTCWLESPDVVIIGSQLVQESEGMVNYIRHKIKTVQDRQKTMQMQE